MNKKTLLLIGCLGILGLCGVVAFFAFVIVGIDTDTPTAKIGDVAQPPATAVPQVPATFRIGDVIKTSEWGDDWTIIVHSVQYPTGEAWHPQEGSKFVLLDLEVRNVSEDPQTLSSMLAYSLKDSTNLEYNTWITSAVPGEAPAGDFVAGEIKRGPVVFQVAEEAEGFTFVFEPATFGSERVFVSLQ